MLDITKHTMEIIRKTDPERIITVGTYAIAFDEPDPLAYLEELKADSWPSICEWFDGQEMPWDVLIHSMEDEPHDRWLIRLLVVTTKDIAMLYRLTFAA
jgi:hypothetical protein